MSKRVKFTLSKSGIERAIKEIEEYRGDFFRRHVIFVSRLQEVGIQTINSILSNIAEEERGRDATVGSTEPVLDAKGTMLGAMITLRGSKVLFIEFSAGIKYGTDTYPTEAGAPYGMGTYPGQGHWDDPEGWWYIDEQGQWVHSFGNRAYMPMYHAEEQIIAMVASIAKEVFGGN